MLSIQLPTPTTKSVSFAITPGAMSTAQLMNADAHCASLLTISGRPSSINQSPNRRSVSPIFVRNGGSTSPAHETNADAHSPSLVTMTGNASSTNHAPTSRNHSPRAARNGGPTSCTQLTNPRAQTPSWRRIAGHASANRRCRLRITPARPSRSKISISSTTTPAIRLNTGSSRLANVSFSSPNRAFSWFCAAIS